MMSLNLRFAVIYVLSIWTSGYAADCNNQQTEIDGRCCDLCSPGTYMKEFCSEHRQTVCSPCEEGYFSDEYDIFDRCEECQSCQQEYVEECTLTTNANCSCRSGFLCSNKMCSKCEENKCITGEKPMRSGLIEYSYQCKPVCPDNEYYDVKMDICKPWTRCNAFGYMEQFPGNKTHDSICYRNEVPDNRGFCWVTLGISFALFSIILLVLLSYICYLRKIQRMHRANNNPIGIVEVSANNYDCHMSKEESGLQLIIQDKSKDNNTCSLHL